MFHKEQKLHEAICQDNAERVTKIVGRMERLRGTDEYRGYCALAIEHGSSNALRALFEAGEYFYLTNGGDQPEVRKLVNTACSSSNSAELLSVLFAANTKTKYGKLQNEEFFTKNTPIEFIQARLSENSSLYFGDCLKNTGAYSTEKLGTILTFTSSVANNQSALDIALVRVAETGDVERAKILLDCKASPNYYGAQALLRATEGGHQEMVNLLLPRVRLDLHGSDIVARLQYKAQQKQDIPADIISSIKAAVDEAVPQEREINGFRRVDDHTLSGTQVLPNGLTLTTVFNFALEQELFIKTVDGEPVIDRVVSFDDINPKIKTAMQEILDTLNGKKAAPKPAYKTGLRLRT